MLLAVPMAYGWINATGKAETAIRQHPERFANPGQLRARLGARGATGGFIVGAPFADVAYFSLAVFGPRKRTTPSRVSRPIAGRPGSG